MDLAHGSDVFAERVALDLLVSLGVLGAGAANPEVQLAQKVPDTPLPCFSRATPGPVVAHRLRG